MKSLNTMRLDSVEDVFLQDDLYLTIAEHAAKCNSLFHKCIVRQELVPDPTIMDDQLARFTLWASNMDVYGPLNVSLDYRLRFSPTVVEIIHQLLDIICDTLNSLKPIYHTLQTPSRKRQRVSIFGDVAVTQSNHDNDNDASDSDGSSDQAEENNINITEIIGGTVSRLFRLSNAIRRSARANRARKIEKYRDDQEANTAIAELRLYTEYYIRFRYPEAPDSLRLALVEANSLRLRRLCYQRTHRRRIELSVQRRQLSPPVTHLPAKRESAPTVRFALDVLSKLEDTSSGPKPDAPISIPRTNASTARQTAVKALYAKSTTEVPRAKSALVNNKLSFPPIPVSPECPYCGVILEFKDSSKITSWHNHVVGDLEPFICVYPQCLEGRRTDTSPLTFENSKAWVSHMKDAHGHTWECRAPSHDPMVFEQEVDYRAHSIVVHGVPEAHVEVLSNAARRPATAIMVDCPFGDEFVVTDEAGDGTIFSTEALQLHVAGHIKEIALLTLQKLPDDNDLITENVDSDQALEDEGPGPPVFRASMDSVLADDELDFQYYDSHTTGDELAPSVSNLDLEGRDANGLTIFHRAVQDDDLHLVEKLIREGVSLSSTDRYGKTALHLSCMGPSNRSAAVLACLLAQYSQSKIDSIDDDGRTALHIAAEANNVSCIDVLLDHGAVIDSMDAHGYSPCFWAIFSGSSDALSRLLRAGAKISQTGFDERSAFFWAVDPQHISIMMELLSLDLGSGPVSQYASLWLLDAAASSNVNVAAKSIRLLLEMGANPDYCDENGWSATHFAAEAGNTDAIRILLEAGAVVNAVSAYGMTALHCAANGGHQEVVQTLLKFGFDPWRSTCHGWTVLHHAAYRGAEEIINDILQAERTVSDIIQQDNHGWTALHLAVHGRSPQCAIHLLASASSAGIQTLSDESGLSAQDWLDLPPTSHAYTAINDLAFEKARCCNAITGLRQAVVSGSLPLVRRLSSLRNAVNETDTGRRTALYYAAKDSKIPIMDLLLDRGANPEILPIGRLSWMEFICDIDVLQRLGQVGYAKPSTEPHQVDQLRRMLKANLGKPGSTSSRTPSSSQQVIDTASEVVPIAVSATRASEHTLNPQQKRKAGSGRSSFWKRIMS